ncbi:MAG: tRNA dihydrouridine(20/20a) synthase DusA [Piscirickettsiaceae bacterium CG_4_9_14_3_um_filter_43_564]|nr:tRNA dihydrouridine(20/20a) synthase DusA [Thiomicrospira sp.]OIP95677.1 MAG: tRNA dihydrouridine(20/20a) synthase DusA [Thiomicrospira sp. CG2_30_44_34]PIQ05407.1 MAG: tRNA dihydrouridine(20/20a) synthase DusA [Piscirickettsiaceae bacterium CG18_big_fil_WC_8_21_14_2_50_44_103]PIU38254.1 MAG: tRNA dihydrouridine(20/20a) synthase DusA [Piscirickettsiaceae bacterium CG07_land_8_20_14_0_80_44_28]PIW57627.1 MAG: tRNA dihydrouridine(20/20a) synthase DusA [Piscirickettsiaceae bacterium CG12_big_fi
MPFKYTTQHKQTSTTNNSAEHFSVAPMLEWTDRHCRVFHRHLTRHAWLYTEMVTTGAILYGNDLERFLGHDEIDCPVTLQLGGSNPTELASCAQLGEDWGYSEINLNVGCPSDRVQNNMIGACLMAHPQIVAEAVSAMKAAVKQIPVTVKTRIGIDDQQDFETLVKFISAIDNAGVDGVIIHARKAWLQGLSPKENRNIPPLNYDWVRQIKMCFPDLSVAINGGILSPEMGQGFLEPVANKEGKILAAVDGVMIGRSVYEKPYLLTKVDQLYYDDKSPINSREMVLDLMYPYIENHLSQGGRLNHISRHMLGLFSGLPGGRKWRRHISENAFKPGAGIEVLQQAYQQVASEIQRMEDQII